MRNDYCKIYVDADCELRELIELIRSVSGGSIDGLATIRSAEYLLDVEDNDEFDYRPLPESCDEFLYYRYYCDVEPLPNRDRCKYVTAIATLLQGLRTAGVSAVPACDFEDQLPKA